MPKYCKRCDTEITEFQVFCFSCLPEMINDLESLGELLKHEVRLHRQLKREEKEAIKNKLKQNIFPQGQDLQAQ